MLYLGVSIVVELGADEGVEGVPVRVDDVAADGPHVREDERRADQGVQLLGVLGEVGATPLGEEQGLEQFAEGGHLTYFNLKIYHNIKILYRKKSFF